MENAMVRPRYNRRPVQSKRRRRAPNANGGLGRLMSRQLIICVLLLLIICIARSLHFSAADFVTEKVKYAITFNVELKSVFSYVEKMALEIRNSISPSPADTQTSSTDQTSSSALKTDAAQASGAGQPVNTEAGGTDEASASQTPGDTASLSSTMTSEDTGEEQFPEENATESNTIEASSAIENETSVLAASSEKPENQSGMIPPAEGTLISRFGEVAGESAGTGKLHKGIDIKVGKGTAIRAVLDGKVAETGSAPAYGGYVRLLHEDGLQTIYANCSKMIAQKGDVVKKGDAIAEVGGMDTSVGVHLHFEVWKDGSAVDPLNYINVSDR